MCIENAKPFKGSPKKTVTVWKVCEVHEFESDKLYPLFCFTHLSHPVGRWARAVLGLEEDAGWHAYGNRKKADNDLGFGRVIVHCRMKGIRKINQRGDVIAEWMYIPKSELKRVIRESKGGE